MSDLSNEELFEIEKKRFLIIWKITDILYDDVTDFFSKIMQAYTVTPQPFEWNTIKQFI